MIEFNKLVLSYYMDVMRVEGMDRVRLNVLIEDRSDFNQFMRFYLLNGCKVREAVNKMRDYKHKLYFGTLERLEYAVELDRKEVMKLVFV